MINFCLNELSSNNLRTILFLYGILQIILFSKLLVAHYCAEDFEQFNFVIIFICFIQIVNILVPNDMKANEFSLLYFSSMISSFCNFLINSLNSNRSYSYDNKYTF